MQGQAGKSKIGCFLFAVLFGIAVLVIIMIAPTYVEKISLGEELADVVNSAGARNWNDNSIKNEVIDLCRARGFEISRRDISVNRDPRSRPVRKIRLKVQYSRTVSLSSFNHVFKFTYEGEGLIGRL